MSSSKYVQTRQAGQIIELVSTLHILDEHLIHKLWLHYRTKTLTGTVRHFIQAYLLILYDRYL